MGNVDPKQLLIWAQVSGRMVELVATGVQNVRGILAAAGATEEQQAASLARTHAMYDAAIEHEQSIVDGK